MYRMTHKKTNGKAGYWSPNKKEEVVNRLATYENTGLEPRQVQELKKKILEQSSKSNDGWIPVDEPPKKDYITVFAVDKHDYYFVAVYAIKNMVIGQMTWEQMLIILLRTVYLISTAQRGAIIMTENEAIEIIIRSACSSGKCYDACLYGEGNCEYDVAIIALKEVQQYREMDRRLREAYGDCDGLLETAVEGFCKHSGVDIGKPIKARLLTDEDVDKWNAYREIGTVEEVEQNARDLKRQIEHSERLAEVLKATQNLLEKRERLLKEYCKIGTVEECREAVEKQKPKEPTVLKQQHSDFYNCPKCGRNLILKCGTDWFGGQHYKSCPNCGQAIQWDENLEGMRDE